MWTKKPIKIPTSETNSKPYSKPLNLTWCTFSHESAQMLECRHLNSRHCQSRRPVESRAINATRERGSRGQMLVAVYRHFLGSRVTRFVCVGASLYKCQYVSRVRPPYTTFC